MWWFRSKILEVGIRNCCLEGENQITWKRY